MARCVVVMFRRFPSAESGVDRGLDSGVEVEARIGSCGRSSQCCIDPSNGRSPVV
jgi:hypothetical protein